jgi:hypothetical protein
MPLERNLGRRVLAVACLFWPFAAHADQGPSPPRTLPASTTFTVGRAASAVRVDGVLDDEAWRTAVKVPVAWEWAPGDNIPAPYRTECLLTYDKKNLYVGFRAFDPRPADIRAHLMDRDDTDTLIQDDHVGVMIDTFNDERRAFQFRVNPLGVQADAIFSEQDGVEDFSWDMIWDAVTRIGADGFVVEIALPLKQLRFQPGAGPQTWGFEAFRSVPRNVRHRLSSQPRDRNKGCLLCQENKIAGLEGLTQGRNAELDPTATFSRTDRLPDGGTHLDRGPANGEFGLTGRWSMTPNLTLNGTVNPDFSQVEADVAQLDINERFALFYPEKRPFFLEGIDFFTTPIPAVFTRTIADPTFGAKLTGKQGPNAVGLFVTRDRLNNLVFPANQGSDSATADGEVTSIVGRYRRDVGRGSTLGALYAGREGDDGYHNRQAGVDLFWRASPSDSIRAQYLRTDTRYPGGIASDYAQPTGGFAGSATYAELQHTTRHWLAVAFYEAYSPGFRSDAGFVPRVDFRNVFADGLRRWQRGAGSWFDTIDIGVRGWRTTDWSWTLTDQTVAAYVNYSGPLQTRVQFNMPRDVTVYQGVRYEYLRPNFAVGVKPDGNTNVLLLGRLGGGVDYANGRKATNVVQLSPSFEYRPIPRINLSLTHTFDRLSVEGGRLYTANLTQLKAIYHINVRTFLRAVLQYTNITRTPGLYTQALDARSRKLFSQVLFSFKLNPQTVLFAGYSDNAVGDRAMQLQRQDRTFFLKLGYAWVL